jgi:hypothetical protein
MTATHFKGPVQTGQNTGAPGSTTIGTLIATQVATVANTTSGASVIVLPANSKIVDWQVEVLVSASGNAGGMLVRVGSTADGTKFGQVNCSAKGTYRNGVAPNVATASAAAWNNIGADPQRLFIDVTAQTSATQTDAFSAIFTITYAQR